MICRRQILRLDSNTTAFLCCDIQERFKSHIQCFSFIANVASCLVRAAAVFRIPVVVSEQYPERLGTTVGIISTDSATVFPKTAFTMICPTFPAHILEKYHTFVLFGIEAHVCVQQTALDLISRNMNVVIVTDAVSSSRELDRLTALHFLSSAGAVLMTAESVMFELLRTKDRAEFKAISELAREIGEISRSNPILSTL